MLPLRRAAIRALSARAVPSPLLSSCTRTFVTSSSQIYRPQQLWQLSKFQRRFASDEVKTSETATGEPSEAEQQAAAEVSSITPDGSAVESTTVEGSDAIVEAVVSSQEPATEAAVPESVTDSADAVVNAASSFSAPIASSSGQPPSSNILYVGNLFFEVTEQDLKAYFESLGAVETVRIVYDHRGLSKGFGFVTFKNKAEAEEAIAARNQEVFQGRRLLVQFHRPREGTRREARLAPRRTNPPSKTLFIGNMSFEMSDKDLNDLFREIRNVLDVRVAIDRRSGQPRGFAHADFIDIPSAMKAKEQLEGKEVYGRSLRVDFTMSTPSDGSSRGPPPS